MKIINNLIDEHKFEEAKKLLIDILDKDSNNIEALKLLGLCNVNLDNFNDARINFETVVKYNQEDATSWFYLASCYDSLNDYLHAKTAYLEVIKLRKNYLDAYKNLGILYLKINEAQLAFDIAKKAIDEVEKDDHVLYYLAGTALLSMKEYPKSLEYLEKAVSYKPENPQIYNNLGTAYLTLGDNVKALENYHIAAKINPNNDLTLYNIGSILQIQGDHENACKYFSQAYELENSEIYIVALALSEVKSAQYNKAVTHYALLCSKYPEKSNYKYNLACCYEALKEYQKAINILEQLILINPKAKMMFVKLAALYLQINQPYRAKELYERIMTTGTVSEQVYYEYAMICIKTNDADTAERILKKVIELNPNAAIARKDLGVIFLSKRLFDYAKEEFEKAYELAPTNSSILFEYANFLQAMNEFSKADEIYQKAIQIEPNNANFLAFFALNKLEQNQLQQALEIVEKVLVLVPNDAFILFAAGKIYFYNKEYEKAQSSLIKCLEAGINPEVENLLALTYFEQNEFSKANAIFLKLLEKNPMNTTVLLNCAKCFEKLEDYISAKRFLSELLGIFPEMDEAKELLETINLRSNA